MSKLKLCLFIAFALFVPCSARSSMYFGIELFNNTEITVKVMLDESQIEEIKPGRSREFYYYSAWYLVMAGRSFYHEPTSPFQPPALVRKPQPPSTYQTGHFFGVSFRAQLNPDRKIYLLPKDARQPVAAMPTQPEGFPILFREHPATRLVSESRTKKPDK